MTSIDDLSVNAIASQIVDHTFELAFNYVYHNIVPPSPIQIEEDLPTEDDKVENTNSRTVKFQSVTNNNLKSSIHKKPQVKDGRKRSVQFDPKFIKDCVDDIPTDRSLHLNTMTLSAARSSEIKTLPNSINPPEEEITRL